MCVCVRARAFVDHKEQKLQIWISFPLSGHLPIVGMLDKTQICKMPSHPGTFLDKTQMNTR